jgi:hypothetical protein
LVTAHELSALLRENPNYDLTSFFETNDNDKNNKSNEKTRYFKPAKTITTGAPSDPPANTPAAQIEDSVEKPKKRQKIEEPDPPIPQRSPVHVELTMNSSSSTTVASRKNSPPEKDLPTTSPPKTSKRTPEPKSSPEFKPGIASNSSKLKPHSVKIIPEKNNKSDDEEDDME